MDQDDLEAASVQSVFALMSGEEPGNSIEELSQHPLTVVLGEARSGKTTEFQLAAKRAMSEGRYAFFLRIEDLVHGESSGEGIIRLSLDTDHEAEFDEWIAGQKEAIFLLDAVDEAKLQFVGDYRRAVRKFGSAMDRHLHRTRIIVSCRITEWRPREDLDPLNALLPKLASQTQNANSDKKPAIELVQLLPLDKSRLKKLAENRGITDPDEFLNAISDANAEELAGRPGDAIELVYLWVQQNRLGTLTELIEQNVTRKLIEENPSYRGIISSGKAGLGVERLAAAAVFCGENSIRLAALEQDPSAPLPALNPTTILPEWNAEEIGALLRRPIFDEATYGRVRFHTRFVREFLAASWCRARYEAGCSASDLLNLFFTERYGKVFINRRLTPVAAWLAPHVPELLDKMLRHNPEVFPDEGDPMALPVETRVAVLKYFVERYSERSRTGYHFDRQGLRRFADPALSATSNTLLKNQNTHNDAKALLLDLVQVGKIRNCVDLASQIALNESEEIGIRVDAILALRECGAKSELRKLYKSFKATQHVPERLYGWAIACLYPEVISVEELIELLELIPQQVDTPNRSVKDHLERAIEQDTDPSRMEILGSKLLELVKNVDARDEEGTDDNNWLYPSLCIAAKQWLSSTETGSNWIFEALEFIEQRDREDYLSEGEIKKINERLKDGPASIRETLFWRRYDIRRAEVGDDVNIYRYQLHHYRSFLNLVKEDVQWLLERVYSESDPKRKFTIFDTALQICIENQTLEIWHTRLGEAADNLPELKAHLAECTAPRPRSIWEYVQEMQRWIRVLRRDWRELKDKEAILPYLSDIAAGKESEKLALMYGRLDMPSGNHNAEEVRSVEPLFGPSAVVAFRSGLLKFWQSWETTETKPDGNSRRGDHMALVGVACAVKDGFDFSSLDEKGVKRLTRLAFKELSSPDWFQELLEHHRDIVRSVVIPWLVDEIRSNKSSDQHPRVLSDIVFASPQVVKPFIDEIFEAASKEMPLSINVRRNIGTAFSDKEHRHLLATLSAKHLLSRRTIEKDDFYWISVWLQTEAKRALTWFVTHLSKLPPRDADNSVEIIASMLDETHGSSDTLLEGTPDYISVEVFREFIPLVYAHVRPEDDPMRHGTWVPDARDAAQSFRGRLIEYLANIPGEDAYRTLLELKDKLSTQWTKDWILRKSEEKIEREAFTPWLPSDVIEFGRNNEHDAHTADDLFTLGLKRLVEIKRKLETGDYSLRDLFDEKTDESLLQKHIAERLEELSKARYSVVRENEVDKLKEPDIRLVHKDLGPTSIEIKWAHKWRLLELEKALVKQLVGQYLKASESCYGIFLVANAEADHTWSKRGPNRKMDFSELITHLNALAKKLEADTIGVTRVEVVGIDLT